MKKLISLMLLLCLLQITNTSYYNEDFCDQSNNNYQINNQFKLPPQIPSMLLPQTSQIVQYAPQPAIGDQPGGQMAQIPRSPIQQMSIPQIVMPQFQNPYMTMPQKVMPEASMTKMGMPPIPMYNMPQMYAPMQNQDQWSYLLRNYFNNFNIPQEETLLTSSSSEDVSSTTTTTEMSTTLEGSTAKNDFDCKNIANDCSLSNLLYNIVSNITRLQGSKHHNSTSHKKAPKKHKKRNYMFALAPIRRSNVSWMPNFGIVAIPNDVAVNMLIRTRSVKDISQSKT